MSAAPLNLYRWTREEYHLAIERGVIAPAERLELIDGQIVRKMTHNPPHVVSLRRICRLFEALVGDTHDVRSQAPVALSNVDEPEPDVAIVPGSPEDYIREHPRPHQVDLLIEVSDSTLERDRRYKVPLYARAGIREIWIVDVEGRRLETYREPAGEGYRVTTILAESESVSPLFCSACQMHVEQMLPPRLP